MAAKNTELSISVSPSNGGATASGVNPGAVTRVYGTFATSGGSTTGVVIPGYDGNTGDSLIAVGSLNAARGIKTILGWGFTNNANSNAFKVVKTYDSTAKADKLTITCTANDTFNYWLDGVDGGQNA